MRLPAPFPPIPAVVAIPVRDEAERIADCLIALARQQHTAPPGVLLFVNNTTDGTIAAVQDLSLDLPLIVIEHDLPPELAGAGQARRMAMEAADRLAPPHVPLLCTDADGRAAPGWLAANLAHLRAGPEAVFGRAVIDPVEAARIPPALHQADAQECAYAALLDEIEHRADPDPDDPWPRHVEHSGASIAVTRAAYHRAGGIPAIALGEDRAFAAALRQVDARVRHPMDVSVVVSGRILGRAVGGMADTIRRRLVAPDVMLDDRLEPAADFLARITRRRIARIAHATARAGNAAPLRHLATKAGLSAPQAALLVDLPYFGQAWAQLDAAAPRTGVPVADLPRHSADAARILAAITVPSVSSWPDPAPAIHASQQASPSNA